MNHSVHAANVDKCAIAGQRLHNAVILLTDTVNNMCKEKLINIKLNYKQPLIVVIPDRHGRGSLSDSITSYVKDAVGLKI